MLSLIARYEWNSFKRYLRKDRIAKLLTLLGFVLALSFLVGIVYESFYYGFRYVAKDEYFGEAVTIYVVELFFLVASVFIFASALVTSLSTLFSKGSDELLLASPHHRTRLTLVVTRIVLTSLWPLVVIITPALVALLSLGQLSVLGLLLSLVSSVLLVSVSCLFALLVVLLIADILDGFGRFTVRRTVFGVASLSVLAFGSLWLRFRSLDLVAFFQARRIDAAVPDLSPILHQFSIFPSHLSALSVVYGEIGDVASALGAIGYLALLLVVLLGSFHLLRGEYLGIWQRAQERTRGIGTREAKMPFGLADADTPVSAILRKEGLVFFRDPRGVMWVGFILLVWAFQGAAEGMLARGLVGERVASSAVPLSLDALQYGITLYFVAMFVLRFAFPSFSSERKSFWSVRSAPVSMDSVYVAKLGFFSVLFSSFAVTFTSWHAVRLELSLSAAMPIVFLVILGTFALTVLGLSLGAMFPSRDTDDPERLSTTLPGVGFIIIAILYGGAGSYALERFLGGEALLVSLFIFVSLTATLLLSVRTNHAISKDVAFD